MLKQKKQLVKVICFGTFDGLHMGHLSYFKQAKKLGDHLIVIVARDVNAKKIKGKLPKVKEKQRLHSVSDCKLVDEAHLGNVRNKYAVINKYQPDVICLGYDQQADEKKIKTLFPEVEVVRLKPHKPHIYKSKFQNPK